MIVDVLHRLMCCLLYYQQKEKKQMSCCKTLKNHGKNTIHKFTISSKDYDAMEDAFDSLPYSYRRSQAGSGYALWDGTRDHSFYVRGYARAKFIEKHYKKLIKNVKFFDEL